MTTAEINTILTELGESQNSWITLEDKISMISLFNDSTIYIQPISYQFYFDSASQLLYKRITSDCVRKIKAGDAIPNGYVSIQHYGENYLMKLKPNGFDIPNIGKAHQVVSYSCIASMEAM